MWQLEVRADITETWIQIPSLPPVSSGILTKMGFSESEPQFPSPANMGTIFYHFMGLL